MPILKIVPRSAKSEKGLYNSFVYIGSKAVASSGHCCSGDYVEAYEDFLDVQRSNKLMDRKDSQYSRHLILSCEKDELPAETMLEYAERVVEAIFPEHQCYMAVHTDAPHSIHAHLLVNSVSFETFKKLTQTKEELQGWKEISNAIGEDYHLKQYAFGKDKKDTRRNWSRRNWQLENLEGFLEESLEEARGQVFASYEEFFQCIEEATLLKFQKTGVERLSHVSCKIAYLEEKIQRAYDKSL